MPKAPLSRTENETEKRKDTIHESSWTVCSENSTETCTKVASYPRTVIKVPTVKNLGRGWTVSALTAMLFIPRPDPQVSKREGGRYGDTSDK